MVSFSGCLVNPPRSGSFLFSGFVTQPGQIQQRGYRAAGHYGLDCPLFFIFQFIVGVGFVIQFWTSVYQEQLHAVAGPMRAGQFGIVPL